MRTEGPSCRTQSWIKDIQDMIPNTSTFFYTLHPSPPSRPRSSISRATTATSESDSTNPITKLRVCDDVVASHAPEHDHFTPPNTNPSDFEGNGSSAVGLANDTPSSSTRTRKSNRDELSRVIHIPSAETSSSSNPRASHYQPADPKIVPIIDLRDSGECSGTTSRSTGLTHRCREAEVPTTCVESNAFGSRSSWLKEDDMNIETENHKNIVSFDSALFESYAKDQVCQEPISDAENIHLYNLRHDRQSIIIDSIDSRIAPHIAITPTTSDETWEEYTRVMTDMAPPCPCCLQLPQRTNWADAMPPIAAPNHSHEWLSEAPTTVCHRADSSYARRVFSHEQFYRTISSAQQERLIMCHVVKALHRHLFKVTAVLVSITAISFRERYDLPGFVDSIEKPFEWSDPAQPILNQRRKTHSLFTTIIESQFPCTVPHIVIDDAPPQPPWIGTMNYVNHGYEQDVERLYVPQAVYGFSTTYDEAVEVQSTPEEKEWAEVVETWDYEYGLDGIPELSLSQLMEAESPPDSPVVRTPSTKPDSLVSVSIYPVDPGDDIDDPEFLLPDAYATSSGKLLSEELAMATCQFTLVIHPPSEDSFTRTGFDIFDDDEEELPPLSGWCLDTWKQMQEQEQQALEVC